MKELGEYLKRTRVGNGVSITEACEDLEFSTSHLENIESGNVKAFKDVYELKESIRVYAKYLGLNPDKVMDEFNNFLFQHTSKISLEDILAAQKKKEEQEAEHKKVKSPYTKEYKEKINLWPFVYVLVGVLVLFVVIYIIISSVYKKPERINELQSCREEISYEFAN
ncbi:MAG: helix-turn-helix domain-containing protein [Bacilli bacterium]|nr:helix-turn-helix domain-containing protein [Bacilli bacterium]